MKHLTRITILKYIWKKLKIKQGMICEKLDYYGDSSIISKIINGQQPGTAFNDYSPTYVYDHIFSERVSKRLKQQRFDLDELLAFLEEEIDIEPFIPEGEYTYKDFVISMLEYGWDNNASSSVSLNRSPNKNRTKHFSIISSFGYASSFFVGREKELEEIDKYLSENRIVFLSGIGGIGKSELAQQYALKYKDKYSTISFGIINDDNDSLLSLVCNDNYISVSELSKEKDEDIAAYFNRKIGTLRSVANDSNLIIIDNFNNIDDKDLSALLSVPCRFIFTTRCNLKQFNYPSIEVKRLEKDDEVRHLFNYYYTSDISEDEKSCVDKLLQLVDYHTITVEILAKTMDNGDFLPSEMLSKLKDVGLVSINEEDINLSYSGSNLSDNALNILKTIFDINNLNDEQIAIMNCLALIPPQGIKRNSFRMLCNLPNTNEINKLISLGWVKRSDVTNHISLHPVVSEVISSYGNITFENCKSFICALENYISSCDDKDKADAFEIAKYAPLRIKTPSSNCYQFIKACLVVLKDTADISVVEPICSMLDKVATSMECDNDTQIYIYQCIGNTYKSYTLYQVAKDFLQKAIDSLGKDNTIPEEDVAEIYRDLGNVYKNITNLSSAIEMYEKALEIRKRLFGDSHVEIAKSYNNIGVSYTKNDQAEKALLYHKKAMSIFKTETVENKNLIAWTYNCFGIAELRLDHVEPSINYHMKALGLYDLSKPSDYLAYTYWDLGDAYRKKGDLEGSVNYHNMALAIRSSLYGEVSRDVAMSLSQLAYVYCDFGDFNKAIEYAEKALKMRIKLLGENAWDVAWSYHSLGDIYLKKEEYEAAKEYYIKAMNIRILLAGEDNNSMVYTYLGLGDACKGLKNDFADEYYKKALKIANDLLPNDHIVIKELNQKLNNV